MNLFLSLLHRYGGLCLFVPSARWILEISWWTLATTIPKSLHGSLSTSSQRSWISWVPNSGWRLLSAMKIAKSLPSVCNKEGQN